MEGLRRLLAGLDTVQVCYYLRPTSGQVFSFEALTVLKERARASKIRDGVPVDIGGWSFQLRPSGSGSGYPLILEHPNYTLECGEYNNPSFFVTFRSRALWQHGAAALHQSFLTWAASVGLTVIRPESLSRVDFTFDYQIENPDFTIDSVVSLSAKDDQRREDRRVQTIMFGKGDVVLRIYDKIAEIEQSSEKVWFYELWGDREKVWRIEWQVRKDVLRRFGIMSFGDLFEGQGDVLRYLVNDHDTLRVLTEDTNRSRWPLHPLWVALAQQIEEFRGQGVYRVLDPQATLNAQLQRIAVSVYGYQKRVAAILSVQDRVESVTLGHAATHLRDLIDRLHDPLSWRIDVAAKREQTRLGIGSD
jgi:hypothetical protein